MFNLKISYIMLISIYKYNTAINQIYQFIKINNMLIKYYVKHVIAYILKHNFTKKIKIYN